MQRPWTKSALPGDCSVTNDLCVSDLIRHTGVNTTVRTLAVLIAQIAISTYLCLALPEVDDLAQKIQPLLEGPEWQIVKDISSITVIHKNVQFQNPINLPALLSEKELWERFSITYDYRITISLDTKLSQQEYDKISRLRQDLISQRTAKLERGSREDMHAFREAEHVVRLPVCFLPRFSVYYYSSDEGFFRLRPESVTRTRDKIVAVLESTGTKYAKKSEQ